MRLPADRESWTPRHAEQAVAERDKAFARCEEFDAKFGRDHPKTLDAWMQYFHAEDTAKDVCTATSSKSLLALQTETPSGALSDKTKGIITGAASALALVGLVYVIRMEEDRAKLHIPPPVDLDQHLDEAFVEVVETPTEDGGMKVTAILKDVGTVGMAARGIVALEPIAEMLIALL